MAEDESKGAAKVALRSSSAFPVSDAANIAKPVSRKHSLGDRILLRILGEVQDTCILLCYRSPLNLYLNYSC